MKRLAFPILIGLLGLALLIALGLWQLRRLEWKEGVLSQIEARVTAEPVAIPTHPIPETDRYLPVKASGLITQQEVHVLVSTAELGAAFRVISLFQTDDGRRLLLDRGLIPDDLKYVGREPVEADIVGNLHWPDEIDLFTPEPDRAENIWFARDTEALAHQLIAEPFLVVLRESSEENSPVIPMPVSTTDIPNNHLEYAITWFGLAAVWAGMTLFWITRVLREKT